VPPIASPAKVPNTRGSWQMALPQVASGMRHDPKRTPGFCAHHSSSICFIANARSPSPAFADRLQRDNREGIASGI